MSFSVVPVGAIAYGKAGQGCKVMEVLEGSILIETSEGAKRVSIERIVRWSYQGFSMGDRVTLIDKYQVRAADVGTVEAITDKGIQVLWDNNSAHERLTQPPILWRTFRPDELEFVDQDHPQN